VLDGFTQQLTAMKLTPASVTSYKRGASDFSAQVAKDEGRRLRYGVARTVLREPSVDGRSKKLGWDVTFLGATPTNGARSAGLGKEAVEGLVCRFKLELRNTESEGLARQLQENVRGSTPTPGDHRLQCGMTFAHYDNKAGRICPGQKMLDALESGDTFLDTSVHRRPCVSEDQPSRHHGHQSSRSRRRWVLVKEGLDVLTKAAFQK